MDDKDLIRDIRRGRLRAFDALYDRHATPLYRFVLNITKRHELAEEIVQDAFIKVIQNLNLEFDRARFSTWLYKVARNRALNVLRDDRLVPDVGVENQVAASAASDERVAEAEYVNKVLEGLKPGQREVFLLKNQGGFSYEEIAQIVGCPIGTVRSRLHEAVRVARNLAGELRNEV